MKNRSIAVLIVLCVVCALAASGIMFYESLPQAAGKNNNRVILPAATENSANGNSGGSQAASAPLPPANDAVDLNSQANSKSGAKAVTNPNDALTQISGSTVMKLEGSLSCDQSCQMVGYQSGYCGKWTENADQTITECETGEFTFDPHYYNDLSLSDCTDGGDPLAKTKTVCCCKGKPQNEPTCPAIDWPTEPMECIEQPGFLKDPATGRCCWYEATCYGPKGWAGYQTRSECMAN